MSTLIGSERSISNTTEEQPLRVEVSVRLPALVFAAEDGGYTAEVPALPGCVTEADSIEQVLANLREAAEGWLAAKHDLTTSGWHEPAGPS